MPARNVNLTEYLADFVDSQVETGRHQNASEVVREALRRYERDLALEQERIASVRQVIAGGRAAISQGSYRLMDSETESDALYAKLTRTA